jgi:hypothetical protein
MLLACHTHNVYEFFLERDTCVLIVVSQGTRNSFLLEFIKRYYLKKAVVTDLRYSPDICLVELTENVWTASVFGHVPNPETPKYSAGVVGEFMVSTPLHLSMSQFEGLTSVSG